MFFLFFFIIAFVIFVLITFFKLGFNRTNKKLKEGMKLESAGKYQEALGIYDYLSRAGNATPELRWRIANVAIKLNFNEKAKNELSVIIDTNKLPENVSILAVKSLMADCYKKMGLLKEAFLEIFEIYKMFPNDASVQFELAKTYAEQRMTGQAIRLFEKYRQQNPNGYDITYYLGRAYLDAGNSSKAQEFLEKTAKKRYYDKGKVNYYLGVLYYSQKKHNIALQHFAQVLKLNPADSKLLSNSHNLIALCYKEKGLIDEAIVNFEKSQTYSELLPNEAQNKEALYNQGVLLYKNGQYKKALKIFYKIKMMDYKFKNIDRVIEATSAKIKNANINTDKFVEDITVNPLADILNNGILYSKVRFNIEKLKSEIEKNLIINDSTNFQIENSSSANRSLTNTIEKYNSMSSKTFKDFARKLVKSIGFAEKSEPKFFMDDEYIDGNAINFYAVPLKNIKSKNETLITFRRYKESVSELSISRFIDWLELSQATQGIFIASSSFSTQALKVIQTYPSIKFIDQTRVI